MHFETPSKVVKSFKEFLSHYAMIVLSILTALALEQIALSTHHQAEASSAKVEIEQEIRENHARISAASKELDETLKVWRALMADGVVQLKAHNASSSERLNLLRKAASYYRDGLPSLRTNAWDAAIASQSVNYLNQSDLRRYSELYSTQKFVSQTVLNLALDGTIQNMADMTLALNTENVDPLEAVRILNWRVRTLSMIQSNLAQLDAALNKASSVK
ncbi:hypothetical protein NX784_18455 [Massilia pinisoli]|uniref:Methyl-accepting chemotaxis protein n=1 Tax=Massilia pinisoli TaxID=1772194 RepID=A0ABT1ZUI7_9BURK|nr:hypothetical protein [Massilia pinisoli]MCS0583577.1 hypothetical protein [Massilia pinisoli]